MVRLFPACLVAVVALRLGAQPSPALPTLTAAEWREDLRHFARELPKRHMNAFHTTPREVFDREIAQLDSAIPSLRGDEIVVRLMRICAMVGDGHTGVHLPQSFGLYPLSVVWFGNELRVTAAAPEHRAALGGRVTAIDGMPIAEAMTRVKTVMSRAENEWYEIATSQAFLVRPEILHALGIVKDPATARYSLTDDAGKSFELAVAAIALDPAQPLRFASAAGKPLFARQNAQSSFWFAFLPDSQTLYVNFRRYDDVEKRSKELFEFIDTHRVTRLVIDLRQNGGGDFTKVRRSLLPGIKQRPAINTKGNLFVIIGRHTYSAALANAVDFRKETQAILVGEPIGERPNSYSENDEMTLPKSKLIVSYSTRFYKFVDEDVTVVLPDQRIDPAWEDFRAGRDAVLEWIVGMRKPGG